jgi:molybdopterin-guanine dinucleotide biosynthesis protein A
MGRPKAWLPIGAERMLQRIVRLLGRVADPLVVVAAAGQELPPLPGTVLIARDPVPGLGPLQGLAAGLGALPETVGLAFATATDVPFLRPDWVRRLTELIGECDLAIPHADGYHHPLAALYRRRTALPAIDALLREDRRRPVFLLERLRARVVEADELRGIDPNLDTLRNLNTREDYRQALEQAGMTRPCPPSARVEETLPEVRVELCGVTRHRAGAGEMTVRAATVGDALRALGWSCPSLVGSVLTPEGSLQPAYTLNLNGERLTTDPGTSLNPGDFLLVMAVDVGG